MAGSLRNVDGDQENDKPVVGVAFNWLLPLKHMEEGDATAATDTAGYTLTTMVAVAEQPFNVPLTP